MDSCKGLDPWAFFRCVLLPTNAEAFWVFIQALAVVIAFVVALLQLRASLRTEALKNAMKIAQDYFSARFGEPSVSDALHTLASTKSATIQPLVDKVLNKTVTQQEWNVVRPIISAFMTIDNYFDEAADLFERRGIDRDYFLSRQVNIIQQTSNIMAPYYDVLAPMAPNANRVSMERLSNEAVLYQNRAQRKASLRDKLVDALVVLVRAVTGA